MIEKFKKYLVAGCYEIANYPKREDYTPYRSAWIVEEVWAMNKEGAKKEWCRKVLPKGVYINADILYEIEEL